jgi:anhydro-N-acetylmuramic acid kinase
MSEYSPVWALGLMSGTSMDGIDAAIIETDGEKVLSFGPSATTPYSQEMRDNIAAALGISEPSAELIERLTDAHAEAVMALMSAHQDYKERISIIGLHGHTVLHTPENRKTLQIGDGDRLARKTGCDVVYDFRTADVAAGGQGAPFAPLYHRALAGDLKGPLAVVNIGGISNITWIGDTPEDDPIAFDTGPGNALLDDWVYSHCDLTYDRDGAISSAGGVDAEVLDTLLENAFFRQKPPKSLDRLDFDLAPLHGLACEDGAATLVAFTCRAIASQMELLPSVPARLLITGGGRKNPSIMAALEKIVGVPVDPVEAVGWDGDAMEAQAFAFLAVRSLRGLPLSVPSTTGVPKPTTGGRLSKAA